MGTSSGQSFRIVLAFLVAVGVARVTLPHAEGANPAGEAEEVTTGCNRPEWTLTLVDPNVIDADSYGSSTAIFIDSLDRLNFIYAKGPFGVDDWKFEWAVSTPSGLRTRTLPTEQASARPSVTNDSQDRIHLCWRSGGFFGEGVLSYGKVEGGQWQEEIVDPEPGSTGYCSIAVDANDNPHIVYTPELAGRPMRYAHWDGTAWIIEDVIVQGGLLSPSLAMDSAGEPHVVYTMGSGTEVDYAFRSGGTWSFETIATIPAGQALATSLVLDSLDRPHVAYDEFLAVGIRYAKRTPAGWITRLVDSGQRWDPSLVLDANGAPHIVYYDADVGALRYATLIGGRWCRQVIDDSPSDLNRIGRDPAIVLDRDGRAHVSYHAHPENRPCKVKYAVSTPLAEP
jgi:hypothetical protein